MRAKCARQVWHMAGVLFDCLSVCLTLITLKLSDHRAHLPQPQHPRPRKHVLMTWAAPSALPLPPWGSYWPNCDSNCAAMRQSHIILNANMQQDTAAAVAEVSVQPFWPLPVLNLCTAHTHTTTHSHTHTGKHSHTPTSAETNCSFRVWLRQMEYLIKTCADKGCHPPSPFQTPSSSWQLQPGEATLPRCRWQAEHLQFVVSPGESI